MELLVLGAYLQDGQAWTVAWKCLIPNNYSFLNISLSPTGNFWWFRCVSLWNSKPSWLQKIRKQLHSKPDFLLSLDCLGIIVQLYVVRKLRKCGFQISLCFPVSQIWKVWCHFWIFYFANLLLKYETPVPYTKQIGVEIKGMFGANLKLYRYPHTKFGETIHILLPLPMVPTVTQEFDHSRTTESSWHEISLGTCNVKFCKTTCWTRIFQLRSQYLPSNDHISQALIPLMDALRIINLIILGRVKFSKHVLGIEPKGLVVHTTFEQSKLYKSCLFGPIVLSNLCKIFKS